MPNWCPVCCTDHAGMRECPGNLPATSPESQGWRICAETHRGIEGYGVLLARSGPRWRARILTFPNVLWTIPGGDATIKFVGRSREAVERQAIDFIRAHCGSRGYTLRDELELVDGGADPSRPVMAGEEVATRHVRILPIRFGTTRPVSFGRTGNLSATGLFVNTAEPLPAGENAGMMLELEHCKLPLRGSVVWSRNWPAPARPAGMGVHLLDPPRTYVRYVDALAS